MSTGMLSAGRLPAENPVISPYLITNGRERPLPYQLFMTSANDVEKSIDALRRFGADAVGFNLGCPAPPFRQAGGGSSFMNNSTSYRKLCGPYENVLSCPCCQNSTRVKTRQKSSEKFLHDV